jgi:N-methylhydantoinase A
MAASGKASADLRYRGQAFELMLPLAADRLRPDDGAALVAAFHAAHRQRFSFDDPKEQVELVTLRLAATGDLGGLPKPASQVKASGTAPASRPVWLGGWKDVPIIRQEALGVGQSVQGPAIIEQDYTSLLITEGWCLSVADAGDMIAEKRP